MSYLLPLDSLSQPVSLVSLGQGAGEVGIVFIGAMVVACLLNMTTIGSLSELNALMPNITGGLAQYTLACMGPVPTIVSMVGGYLICNILSAGVEASIFAYAMSEVIPLPIPSIVYTVVMMIVVMATNLIGVDMFAKVQDLVAFLLVGSMVLMGLIGIFKLGTGTVVSQPANMASSPSEVISMTAVAFWLFIGAEFAIPISGQVKNAKKKCSSWNGTRTYRNTYHAGNNGSWILSLHSMGRTCKFCKDLICFMVSFSLEKPEKYGWHL